MTNHYWNSFNFSETNELLSDLLEGSNNSIRENKKNEVFQKKENTVFKEQGKTVFKNGIVNESNNFINRDVFKKQIPKSPIIKQSSVNNDDSEKERNPLENILIGMCRRGGFHGAVIADINGLPLAVYNSPVKGDVLAAYTTILGESLEKASAFMNMPDANNISMDINILDKIVLRRFYLSGISYYLMIIAPQNIDERAEIEVILSLIPQILI